MKFVRIVFFYALYFTLCSFVVTTLLESWPVGFQALFAFLSPAAWIWWRERIRARKQSAVNSKFGADSETVGEIKPKYIPNTPRYVLKDNSNATTKERAADAKINGRNENRAVIMKFIRIVFFYALYFILCMIVVVTLLESWPAGFQMLFAFLTPAAWIWWRERRRARKQSAENSKIGADSEAVGKSKPKYVPNTPRYNLKDNSDAAAKEGKAASKMNGRNENRAEKEGEAIRKLPVLRETELRSESRRSKPVEAPSPKRPHRFPQGWVPNEENVKVAGRDIGGMVYVGTPPLLNDFGYRGKCRAYIDPSLSVARRGTDKLGDGMPYWPGYSDISPQCRATYLDWLASGRSDESYNPGYMFLYFYGLERRFVLDQPSAEEKLEILDDVQRLARLYSENRSVQRYLGDFIQIAQMSVNDADTHEPVYDYSGWELPLSLKVAIGARIGRDETISSDWALSWLLCHPERIMRTAADRCDKEFQALFHLRFDDRYPKGLKVAKPRKFLKGTYQAASSEFQAQLSPEINGKPIPDISNLRKPVEIAQEIADEVMDDLDKFSRYLGRNPDGRGSLEAQALLPSELWPLFPSDQLDALKSWAGNIVKGGGRAPVIDVIERLEGARPDKLSKRKLTDAADALARVGFGFAPDPRFALRSPSIGEPVVVFDLGGPVEQLEEVSQFYRASLIELALGTFVAHADGQIEDAERKALLDRIAQIEGLTEQERRRLIANLDWLLAAPPDLTLLRRKLKETGPESQAAIRAALVFAALADGIIQSEEVAGIEKVYKALGLDPALVYSDLHAGDVQNGPISVMEAQHGTPGEAIPQEPTAVPPTLNFERIKEIRSDTERVSIVLGKIFTGDGDEEPSEEVFPSSLKGLDGKHANLVRDIIVQEHWTEEAFDELCKRFCLMPSGALEAINEWAYGAHDEALLDEYDGYDVAPEIAEALRVEFKEAVQHGQT